MESLLILPKIKVEGANSSSGIIFGFPAVTHFLGYVHAISRDLYSRFGVKLGRCGIICHHHQIHAYPNGGGGEFIFSLTRNPLTDKGETAPFNEEAKLSMEVSLIIECGFTLDDFDDSLSEFLKFVQDKALIKRLAGGVVKSMSSPTFHEIPQNEEKAESFCRNLLRKMLPGFALCDRSNVFGEYLSQNHSGSPFDALLDFYTLKSKYVAPENDEKKGWVTLPKPKKGWFVPVQLGYKAISPVYESGQVACVRDHQMPFCFVEPAYGLAEWLSPHRIKDIQSIFWGYQIKQDFYLCTNNK